MRLTVFATAAVSSALALVGFAGVANASATVDLVWIDVSSLDTNGNVICLKPANRDCPQLGSTISIGAVTDSITLGVIITAGPGSILAVGVDVDYNDALPKLSVSGFRILTTAPYLPTTLAEATNDTNGWVQSINAVAFTFIDPPVGIGLPAGATAYLGTVTFHKDQIINGSFDIAVGVDGPDGVSNVIRLDGATISDSTTFNSAFLVNLHDPPTPTATPTGTPSPGLPTGTPSATPTPGPPTPTPTATPTITPTATPTPSVDCLCQVTNITPDTINLNKVGSGGKQSKRTRRIIVQVRTVDAPGAICDRGETSGPQKINLLMVDDDGDILIDSAKTLECDGTPQQLTRNVFLQGPLNCKDSAVPDGTSSGFITATGSAFGSPDYVELLNINCNE